MKKPFACEVCFKSFFFSVWNSSFPRRTLKKDKSFVCEIILNGFLGHKEKPGLLTSQAYWRKLFVREVFYESVSYQKNQDHEFSLSNSKNKNICLCINYRKFSLFGILGLHFRTHKKENI